MMVTNTIIPTLALGAALFMAALFILPPRDHRDLIHIRGHIAVDTAKTVTNLLAITRPNDRE